MSPIRVLMWAHMDDAGFRRSRSTPCAALRLRTRGSALRRPARHRAAWETARRVGRRNGLACGGFCGRGRGTYTRYDCDCCGRCGGCSERIRFETPLAS